MPGAGHWYAGHRRLGLVLIGISLLAAIPLAVLLVLIFFVSGASLALDVSRPFFSHPEYLLILLAANLGIFVLRVLSALDAYFVAGGRFRGPRALLALTGFALLVAFVAAPHGWAASRNLALHDLLTYDYSVDPNQAAPTSTPSTTAPSTTLPASTTTEPDSPTTAASSTTAPTTTAPTTTTTTITMLPPLAERRVNIMLLGADAAPDRPGIRTDTIIVASVDPVTKATALFQLPRNQIELPIPPGHAAYDVWECHCYPDLINSLYQYALAHPDQFPGGANAGATALMDLVGHLYGIEIHQYALVELLGFVSVIDALGSLTITVTAEVEDEQYTRPGGEEIPVLFTPGTYEMDGEEVLSYARVRRGTDDYTRMGRQRCVLEAIAAQANPATLIQALPNLVPAVQDSILTDIPIRAWPDFIKLATEVDTTSIVSIRFMPRAPELVGTGTAYVARTPEGYWVPIVEMIRSTVLTVISMDSAAAAETLRIAPLGEVCGISD